MKFILFIIKFIIFFVIAVVVGFFLLGNGQSFFPWMVEAAGWCALCAFICAIGTGVHLTKSGKIDKRFK